MSTTTAPAAFTVVVPCAAEKREGTHAARDLYTSSNFRSRLTAAEAMATAEGGQVLILSALYGLVALDEQLTSYDVRMGTGHPDEVTAEEVAAQLIGFDATDEVHVLAPADYFAKVDAAARMVGVLAHDLFEGDPAIGFQRRVARCIRESYAA